MDVMAELEKAGAVLLDKHFVYKSGKHGSGYINMDPLFPNVSLVAKMCEQLAEPFWVETDTVAAPAVGGIALSVLTAAAFHRYGSDEVRAIWADKSGDDFVFERAGFINHLRGKDVLVVEDLLTTGGSVAKVCRQVEQNGGEVIGVSVICNRGRVTAEGLGVPRLESLANVSFEAIEADDCPLCEQQVPVVEDIGHGATFRGNHPTYPGGYIRLLRLLE